MNIRHALIFSAILIFCAATTLRAQDRHQKNEHGPAYRIAVVPSTITTISYRGRTSTQIGFQASPLMPDARGEAKVSSKPGRVSINARFEKLEPANHFGPEYLTYVLWAITPQGQTRNLGELILTHENKGKLDVTTPLQTFGLIVTAEPYYAVVQPSDAVVLENVVTDQTQGTISQANANYEAFERSGYNYDASQFHYRYPRPTPEVPLEIQEAWNAVAIASIEGADAYASDGFQRAETSLTNAEEMYTHHGDKKDILQDARDAVQNAADARNITIRRAAEELQAAEQAAAAKREADARAAADAAAAQAQQEAEARRQAELQAQQQQQAAAQAQADQQAAVRRAQEEADARHQAELQAQQQQQAAQQAAAQAQAAEQEAQQQRDAAARAQQELEQARSEQQQLRAQLLEQFNRILPTTDTPQGLKVNLSDVLFDFGKYNLREGAREALAKFAGIVLAHPGLRLSMNGYTDSIGNDVYNLTLSQNRANSVKAYLIAQGLDPSIMNAVGYGKADPVASNDTRSGRQQNRRVEVLISGDIIGQSISLNNGQQTPPDPPAR